MKMRRRIGPSILIAVLTLNGWFQSQSAASAGELTTRIKDIAKVVGIRGNQLVGYGLVVGLDGTGDDQKFTFQSMKNLLERFNLTLNLNDVDPDNVAAVMVTTELPPFAVEGSRLDVTVSSIGDAKSLQGGTLLLTGLRGVDNQVYALAQGAISIGGFVATGGGGNQKVQKNHVTVGRIPGGAIVEYPVATEFVRETFIDLALNDPDFTTASNIEDSINRFFGRDRLAMALDPGTVRVNVAQLYPTYSNPVRLVADLERINVRTDAPARVVINERTGTVISGQKVRISTVAISHGALTIQVQSTPMVSQPLPFSDGQTITTRDERIDVTEEGGPLRILRGEGATVEDLVNAFQAIDGGLSPRDLIAIFEALKEAGALKAELIIM